MVSLADTRLVLAVAGNDCLEALADSDAALAAQAQPETQAHTRSELVAAVAEDNSAGGSAVLALMAAMQPVDMLSAVAAAGSATLMEPHCQSQKSTCSDAYRRSVVVGEPAPAGNGSRHSGAFVGAEDDESCDRVTTVGTVTVEIGE